MQLLPRVWSDKYNIYIMPEWWGPIRNRIVCIVNRRWSYIRQSYCVSVSLVLFTGGFTARKSSRNSIKAFDKNQMWGNIRAASSDITMGVCSFHVFRMCSPFYQQLLLTQQSFPYPACTCRRRMHFIRTGIRRSEETSEIILQKEIYIKFCILLLNR